MKKASIGNQTQRSFNDFSWEQLIINGNLAILTRLPLIIFNTCNGLLWLRFGRFACFGGFVSVVSFRSFRSFRFVVSGFSTSPRRTGWFNKEIKGHCREFPSLKVVCRGCGF